jgi:GNAT superfamily N-acetyltransferase
MKRSVGMALSLHPDDAAMLDKIESFSVAEALENKALIVQQLPFDVVLLDSGRDLSRLIDLLRQEIDEQIARGIKEDETTGFWHNRGMLIDAYKRDELYVLKFTEDDDDTWDRGALWELLKKSGFIIPLAYRTMPCFCVVSGYQGRVDDIDMLWTQPEFRGLGLARVFVQHFEIKTVYNIVPESRGFWEKCGVKAYEQPRM